MTDTPFKTPNEHLIITLPNERQLTLSSPTSVAETAAAIGPGLARQALAGRVNGQLVDVCDPITHDAHVQVITPNEPEGLEIIRHSCAHLVGHAVKQLYPSAEMVIGPVINDGFYYDIAYERPFTPEDMAAIETRMKALISQDYAVVKQRVPREEALSIFRERGEHYKQQLIDDMPEESHLGLYYPKARKASPNRAVI